VPGRPTTQEGETVVWLVESDHWPRALLRAELIERGYDAIGFPSLDEAIVRLAVERERRPALVFLDLAGQPVSRGAVALLSAGGVPVLGLAAATDPSSDLAGLGLTAVLRRPLSLGEIADAIERTLTSLRGRPPGTRPPGGP
jgi:DNA-binding response OmpR family regulator